MKNIFILVLICTAVNCIPSFIAGDIAWDINIACNRFEVFVWVLAFGLFIPYKNLGLKSLVLSLAVFELLDTVIFLIMIFYPLNSMVYVLKIAASVFLFFYIFWKNYDRENDKLDEDHFFIVGIKPNEFQDFLISIIKEPYGGTGIYAQGKFYHYRHGALQVDSKKYVERLTNLNKYQIKKSIKLDKKRIQVLEDLKYSKYKKWSWKNNCKTVLDPVLWKRSKPIF